MCMMKKSMFLIILEHFFSFLTMRMHAQACICWMNYTATVQACAKDLYEKWLGITSLMKVFFWVFYFWCHFLFILKIIYFQSFSTKKIVLIWIYRSDKNRFRKCRNLQLHLHYYHIHWPNILGNFCFFDFERIIKFRFELICFSFFLRFYLKLI